MPVPFEVSVSQKEGHQAECAQALIPFGASRSRFSLGPSHLLPRHSILLRL